MSSPRVRLAGDVAIVAYVRLVQLASKSESAVTMQVAETRVWQRRNGAWKHVHFHRSRCGECR
jgi:calcium/calmodulin-dependent protein kinase (CaM kinase) II